MSLTVVMGVTASADDGVGDVSEALRIDLGGAAGDHDARIGPLAPCAANRLSGLAHRLLGHRAGVEDDEIVVACGARRAAVDSGSTGVPPVEPV